MSYDSWRINGNWHICICGARWSDSDGGPCHWECSKCGATIDEDTDKNGMCESCNEEVLAEAAQDSE